MFILTRCDPCTSSPTSCDGSDEYDGKIVCPNACEGGSSDSGRLMRLQAGARARKHYLMQYDAALKSGIVQKPEVFGKDGAYYGLRNQCLEIKSGVFTYKMCFGDKATQSEEKKADQQPMHLGDWKGFEGDHSFAFGGGTMCGEEGKPGAVARSLKVEVECGDTNEILSEDEPKMCAYTMKMKSPAACDAAVLAEANLDASGEPFKQADEAVEAETIVYRDEL